MNNKTHSEQGEEDQIVDHKEEVQLAGDMALTRSLRDISLPCWDTSHNNGKK